MTDEGSPTNPDGSASPEPRRDPRPEPRWGQYADPASPPIAATPTPEPAPAPAAAPAPVRPFRTWDVVLTTALLAFAVYDVIGTFATYANLSPLIQTVFDQGGLGEFTATAVAQQWGAIANAVRIALLVVVMSVALLLISRRRLAFWVPLVGGVVSIVIVFIALAVIIVSDPAYLAYLTAPQP